MTDGPAFDVLLNARQPTSPQFFLLGDLVPEVTASSGGTMQKSRPRRVALDGNSKWTACVMGAQGSGKSYTVSVLCESLTASIPGVNQLVAPYCTIIFHFSEEAHYAPEFLALCKPNPDKDQNAMLARFNNAQPTCCPDMVVLTPPDMIEDRRAEMPGVQVEPIRFHPAELSFKQWQVLMGCAGNTQALYPKLLNLILKRHRKNITLATVIRELSDPELPLAKHDRDEALMRTQFIAPYLDESRRLGDLVKPGRVIIVDLRDPAMIKNEAFQLLVILLRIFAHAKDPKTGGVVQKNIVVDEAHLYTAVDGGSGASENGELVAALVEQVRIMRHVGANLIFASQDPPSLPAVILQLSTCWICHNFTSPLWLKHLRSVNAAFDNIDPVQMVRLRRGEAYIWSRLCSEEEYASKPHRIAIRASATLPGGQTIFAAGSER
jgi:DNA phosphorothioation-dependent restriction protein DptH